MAALECRGALAVRLADVSPVAAEQDVEEDAEAGEQHEEQRPGQRRGRVALLVDEHQHQADADRVERGGEEAVVLYE